MPIKRQEADITVFYENGVNNSPNHKILTICQGSGLNLIRLKFENTDIEVSIDNLKHIVNNVGYRGSN